MAKKRSKSSLGKKEILRKKKQKEKNVDPPIQKEVGENESSEVGAEVGAHKLLECPVTIKVEPPDPETEKLLQLAYSGFHFDETGAFVGPSTSQANPETVAETACLVSPRQQETACNDDVFEGTSSELQSVEAPSADDLMAAGPSTAPPGQPMDIDDNTPEFKVEGDCFIRMADHIFIVNKLDLVPIEENVGFIGCGPMAEAFIAFLMITGHRVYGYNRTVEKWKDVPVMPIVVSTPAELVEKCNIIFCCVSGSAAVKDIMEKPEGVLEGMDHHPGRAYVEMSSVDPSTILRYSENVNARGGTYLTAQIGRSRPAAYLGNTIIRASGDRETFCRCQPCFVSFCSLSIYLSSNVVTACIGSICQSAIEATSIITLSDIMLAADKMGVDKAAVFNGLEQTTLSKQCETLSTSAIIMMEDRPDVFTPLRHVIKNLRMAIDLKKSDLFGTELLLSALQICNSVLNHYPEARDYDVSCVYKLRTAPYTIPVPEA